MCLLKVLTPITRLEPSRQNTVTADFKHFAYFLSSLLKVKYVSLLKINYVVGRTKAIKGILLCHLVVRFHLPVRDEADACWLSRPAPETRRGYAHGDGSNTGSVLQTR